MRRHRHVIRKIQAAGHGWIIDDEIEGALSYFELAFGVDSQRLAA